MSLLALGLTLFLIEMYIATRSVRVRRDLLMEAHATRTDDPAPPPTGRD
ncbi:hypothetical protein [Hankyongella ginsenosidimutans]|nr:hypothetical protein [Hankyongella ginsenosidimutans]